MSSETSSPLDRRTGPLVSHSINREENVEAIASILPDNTGENLEPANNLIDDLEASSSFSELENVSSLLHSRFPRGATTFNTMSTPSMQSVPKLARVSVMRAQEPSEGVIEKQSRQKVPHDEYQTLGSCGNDEWEYERSRDGIGFSERQCSSLSPDACPELSGALEESRWGEEKPSVVCSYSLEDIKTGAQLHQYVENWGYDDDYNNKIMPSVIARPTKNGPRSMTGPYHQHCSSFLALDDVGKEARRWADTNPTISDAILEEYCYSTGGSDCDFLLRKKRPLYWCMSIHPLLRNTEPEEWYVPARNSSLYIQTSAFRRKKLPQMSKKLKAKVSKAANDLANISDDLEETKHDLARMCACPIVWSPISDRRKRWLISYIKKNPHEYYGRRISARAPEVISDSIVANTYLNQETPADTASPLQIDRKPGLRGSVGTRTHTTKTVAILIGVILLLVIIGVIIYLVYSSQRSQTRGDAEYMREAPKRDTDPLDSYESIDDVDGNVIYV